MKQISKKDREDDLAQLVTLLLDTWIFDRKKVDVRRLQSLLKKQCVYDRCECTQRPYLVASVHGRSYPLHLDCVAPFMFEYLPTYFGKMQRYTL